MRLVILSLASGLLLNVIVAWSCALWSPYPVMDVALPDEEAAALWGNRPSRIKSADLIYWADTGAATGRTCVGVVANGPFLNPGFCMPKWDQEYMVIHQVGWPLHSLAGGVLCFGPSVNTVTAIPAPSFLVPGSNSGLRTPVLPICPLWAGFGVNTFLFAGLLFATFRGLGFMTCMLRGRHGLCVHCGYDVRASAVCPECGTPLGSAGEKGSDPVSIRGHSDQQVCGHGVGYAQETGG